jgi:glycerol-3-phosphate dehydrogenase
VLLRNIKAIETGEFDLLVIGGGIFGACAAWDATLRGLRVLLIEKKDFSSGASANSLKMVHGGIRYMQHLDVARVRSSCHERSALLRIAPHLVQPLPIAMPTYGYGMQGKPFLAAGMLAYDAVTFDRNLGIPDPARHIPRSTTLSRKRLLREFPDLVSPSLTGAAVFRDAQMYNPTRLVLAFIQSAAKKGAVVANYMAAGKFDIKDGRVRGCFAEDLLTGNQHKIKCKAILNATGPWAEELIEHNGLPRSRDAPPAYSRDSCFVIKRRFESEFALAIPGVDSDADALFSRSARHLFVVPWRNYTLVGVWHKIWKDRADAVSYYHADLLTHLKEINITYPSLRLEPNDVLMWNAGLLPFGDQGDDDHLSSRPSPPRLIQDVRFQGPRGGPLRTNRNVPRQTRWAAKTPREQWTWSFGTWQRNSGPIRPKFQYLAGIFRISIGCSGSWTANRKVY